ISFHWQAVIRIPGKITWTPHRPLRVMTKAVLALVGKTEDCTKVPLTPDRLKQLQKGLFALPSYRVVDVRGVQNRRRVIRCKVPSPSHRQVWELRTNFTATANRPDSLWSWHNRGRQQLHRIFFDQGK